MFFSTEVLGVKSNSKLGVVWIAATLGPKSSTRRLVRRDLSTVNIPETCRYLADPPQAWSLRLTSSMMVGVTRVYGQQCSYQYQDVHQFCSRITKLQTTNDLDMQPSAKNSASITMGKIDTLPTVSALNEMTLPDLDIAALLKTTMNGFGTPEQGRKDKDGLPGSSSSSLAKPYYTSSSGRLSSSDSSMLNNDLIGSAAFPDTNFDDSAFADGANFPLPLNLFQRHADSLKLSSMDMLSDLNQIPSAKRSPRKRRITINLFDAELMLDKEKLFLSDREIMSDFLKADANHQKSSKDLITNAISLLTTPAEDMIDGLTDVKLDWGLGIEASAAASAAALGAGLETFNDNDNYPNDIEAYRSNYNMQIDSTPSTKHMPWSSHPGSDGDFGRRSSSDLSLHGLMLSTSSSPTRSHSSITTGTNYQNYFTALPANIQATTSASRDELDFLHFCKEHTDTDAKVAFFALISPRRETRHVAANAFCHILHLATERVIKVRQMRAHGDIEITVC